MALWDTSGQKRFRVFTETLYKSARVVMVVYDVTRRDTFDDVVEWVSDVRRNRRGAVVVLVGNKIDLVCYREKHVVFLTHRREKIFQSMFPIWKGWN